MIKALEHIELKSYNTFNVEAIADVLIQFSETDDLYKLGVYMDDQSLILGGGSNVLFVEQQIPQVIMPEIRGMEVIERRGDEIVIRVGSGEIWDHFVAYCVEAGYGGVENLSWIPGKVGASPIQNIGAYGREVKDVLERVVYFDTMSRELVTLTNNECLFGYRDSIFKHRLRNRAIVVWVDYRLTTCNHHFAVEYAPLREIFQDGDHMTIKQIREAIISIRQDKLPDPTVVGNGGSFFKNPYIDKVTKDNLQTEYPEIPVYTFSDATWKIPAAWFIEMAGWKGRHSGNVQCYPKQPLVLVNNGGATGLEILDFSLQLQQDIQHKFGITLEREINVYYPRGGYQF